MRDEAGFTGSVWEQVCTATVHSVSLRRIQSSRQGSQNPAYIAIAFQNLESLHSYRSKNSSPSSLTMFSFLQERLKINEWAN